MKGLLLESAPLDVFGQMALDEALAKSKPPAFCIRFFRWPSAAATFGYAQRIGDVEPLLPAAVGRAYTRRPTGGGIVAHLDDLTFSCVFPEERRLKPDNIYRHLHAAILDGLRRMGLPARLYTEKGRLAPQGPDGASQCFLQPVALDILSDQGKILGGAIRRFGPTVLYQGSLQLADARRRADDYQNAILDSLSREWQVAWHPGEVPDPVQAVAAALAAKYRSPEWIHRR